MFVSLDEERVTAQCHSLRVDVSVIEALPSGGVRLVCSSSEGAAKMRRKLKPHLLDDQTRRHAFRPTKPLW